MCKAASQGDCESADSRIGTDVRTDGAFLLWRSSLMTAVLPPCAAQWSAVICHAEIMVITDDKRNYGEDETSTHYCRARQAAALGRADVGFSLRGGAAVKVESTTRQLAYSFARTLKLFSWIARSAPASRSNWQPNR
eukprot:6195118-Pleurochrysis_carterae.AAC.6